MPSRDPGDEWLSCINCDEEWDDADALTLDSFGFTDCPECDQTGSVIKVTKLSEAEREAVDELYEETQGDGP